MGNLCCTDDSGSQLAFSKVLKSAPQCITSPTSSTSLSSFFCVGQVYTAKEQCYSFPFTGCFLTTKLIQVILAWLYCLKGKTSTMVAGGI